jgi:hypothetical protein
MPTAVEMLNQADGLSMLDAADQPQEPSGLQRFQGAADALSRQGMPSWARLPALGRPQRPCWRA